MTALLINNVDATTFGFVLTEAPSWIDLPPRTTPSQPVLGKQGSVVTAAPIEAPRRLVLRGIVTSSSVAQTRTNIDNLKIALLAPLVQLTFQDSSTRYITVGLDNFAVQWSGPAMIDRRLRVEIQMTAYDPYFYDTSVTSIALDRAINPWMTIGTGIIRPVLTISGASTNPVFILNNHSSVQVASLGLTITNVGGDSLVVDMDARTVKKNGVSVLSAISSGDFFAIDPSDSTNFPQGATPAFITTNVGGGTGTTAYRRTWR